MTITGVVTNPGPCAVHGYHGPSSCPRCSTGIPQPLERHRRTTFAKDEVVALNAIAAALHRIADALEKETP